MMVRGLAFAVAMTAGAASGQTFVCDGHVTNAYLVTNPGFQTFDARTIVVTLECGWAARYLKGNGECGYLFDGTKYADGYLYQDGSFTFGHLGPWADLSSDGILSFKISEETNGMGGNEGQRWFRAFCEEVR